MGRVVPFIIGFFVAGLIGFLTTLIFGTMTNRATDEKMWKHSEQTLFGVIGLRVLAQLLLLITFLTSICAIIYTLQNEWLLAFVVGFFFAAVIGFHLQNLRKNWKYIVTTFRFTTWASSTNELSTGLENDMVAGDTSLNNSSSSESGFSLKTPVSQIRIKHLEKQLADLLAEHDAVINQLSFSLSEVDRVRLKRQKDTVEREIDEVQNELDLLK